jgi:uncharacterized membrane protein (DUF4010 family)
MSDLALSPLELAGRLAMVLALAVFLGLAFEETYKREDRDCPGGIRTFPLLAVSGAMLYLIEPRSALAFAAGLLALALWLHAIIRHATSGPIASSLVIPASNLVAYLIGPIALTQTPWVVVAVVVSAVLLLGARDQLHRVIQVVPRDELLTAGEFLVLVGIILPLVPNTPVTELTPITPYHVWLAVVAVCTLSYVSYLLQRYLPSRGGALLPAVLGGIYSSTATTIVLAKRLREAGAPTSDLAAGIIAATAMMYVRLGIVIAIFNRAFALTLAPALAGLFALGAAMAFHQWRRAEASEVDRGPAPAPPNPLQITTAGVFAALFIVISLLSAWVGASFGQAGILTLAAIVGASDIDPFVLNIAQGGVAAMSNATLAAAVLIAASSNNVMKAIYAVGFGGAPARRPAIMLLVLAGAGIAAAVAYVAAGS